MSAPSTNPIIPGFAPDPSVTLIDDTFFLVVSSFELFPGLPIFSSKDLISWKHIGNAINRTTQLSLKKALTSINKSNEGEDGVILATGGLYAPTIRHHNGAVYIICTNFVHDGPEGFRFENFVVSTNDIWSDSWSDPVYFDFHGIDPSLFWDDDGRVYVHGSHWDATTTITCQEIDLTTGRTIVPPRTVWEGFTKVIPEGPHIYKKDGFYYLLISEGGTSIGHCLAAARSKSVWGPFESCERNPILEPASEGRLIQHTGHGDLFQDTLGQWWMVCLGVRKENGRYHMGRETFITGVKWHEGDWPVIEPIEIKPPFFQDQVSEGLTTLNPKVDLVYIRDPDLRSFEISENGADVKIWPQQADLSDVKGPLSFVGRKQRALEGTASAELSIPHGDVIWGFKAGLAIYKDEHRFARLFWNPEGANVVFELFNRIKSKKTTLELSLPYGVQRLRFRIRYTRKSLEFLYQAEKGPEMSCVTIDTLDLTGYDFVGPVIGIFAVSSLGDQGAVGFSGFQVD